MFYLDLFAALNRKVDYVLIGGLAIAPHGIERATMDIDVTVAMTLANLASLVDIARELHLAPVLPVPLDILIHPPVDYTGLRSRAVTFQAGSVPVVVAAIDDLIDMKLAVGRPIDRSDVEHLKRLKEF